ncbi:hypothetical protein [Domibacillus mangrovi]|nr:hypothetical protein [Domibacillus mangrovi]
MMLNERLIRKASLSGLIAGMILAVFLKMVEQTTHYKVYTLLLNVDYIPILKRYTFSEFVEVAFHLIISIGLSVCLYFAISYMNITSHKRIISLCVSVCIIIGLILFPTTALSDRTPSITSMPAFSYWLAGHVVYGYTLGFLVARWKTRHLNRK